MILLTGLRGQSIDSHNYVTQDDYDIHHVKIITMSPWSSCDTESRNHILGPTVAVITHDHEMYNNGHTQKNMQQEAHHR